MVLKKQTGVLKARDQPIYIIAGRQFSFQPLAHELKYELFSSSKLRVYFLKAVGKMCGNNDCNI